MATAPTAAAGAPAGAPAPAAVGFGTPFAAQLAFFRRKLNLPTERWDDITRAAHDRAFIVAGAAKADLLADLRTAVDSTMASGGGINEFRKKFKAVVAANGWTGWTGEGSAAGEAWRTRIIYQTNMATSYAAGQWQQMTQPAFVAALPFWRYRHADGQLHPRPQHLAWDGLTLPHDHEFWKTHFAPNGWHCFPAETVVRCGARIGLKTWYAGEMVQIATASGHRLTITANHPILTGHGWVAAHCLQEGDELLGSTGQIDAQLVGVVHDKDAPARADDLFESLLAQGFRVAPMAPDDFHGDARLRKAEIHIAGSDGALVHVVQAERRQVIGEGRLDGALHGRVEAAGIAAGAALAAPVIQDAVLAQHVADSWLGQAEPRGDLRLADDAAAIQRQRLALVHCVTRISCGPGRAELPLDAAGRGLDRLPADPFSLGLAAQDDACADQGAPEQPTDAAGLFGQLQQANPALVLRDQVREVRKFNWAGHVYDFVTDTGLILAGGIVVSNCRCKILPVAAPAQGAPTQPPKGWDAVDPKTGEPVGIDKGFGYAPGAHAAAPLRELVDQKLIKLDAPIGAAMWQVLKPALAMERRLSWTSMVDAVATNMRADGTTLLATTVAPETVAALADAGVVLDNAAVWLRDKDLLHALRDTKVQRGAALPVDLWRNLPEQLDGAATYLDATDQVLLYVVDLGLRKGKVVVRVNYNAKGQFDGVRARITSNFIQTGGQVDAFNLSDARYVPLRAAPKV